MNNLWAFLPMRASDDLLGDSAALRARLDEDGYLLFRGVLDRDRVLDLRRQVTDVLARHGWVRSDDPSLAVAIRRLTWEGEEDFFAVYDDIQRLEAFHTLAHDERLLDLAGQVLGQGAFPHPLKIARIGFPLSDEVSTPPHQDYPNNQGTPDLTAAWTPLGDCPRDLGGLAVLRGSHRYGVLPLAWHMGPGMRRAVISDEMLEALRWVTTDFEAGDVLLFPAMTVHASLHNASEFHLRLSVDFRYQRPGEALTSGVLEPHFQRLSWAEIYEGWSSDRLQYYWRDLDYEVVPFEDLGPPHKEEMTAEDWGEAFVFEAKRNARHERRLADLASPTADEGLGPGRPPTGEGVD